LRAFFWTSDPSFCCRFRHFSTGPRDAPVLSADFLPPFPFRSWGLRHRKGPIVLRNLCLFRLPPTPQTVKLRRSYQVGRGRFVHSPLKWGFSRLFSLRGPSPPFTVSQPLYFPPPRLKRGGSTKAQSALSFPQHHFRVLLVACFPSTLVLP